MDLADRTIAAIATLLEASSWQADVIGNAILVHPLGLKITAQTHHEDAAQRARCVLITAIHHERFPDGIQEHAVGLGDTDDEVAAHAAETWVGQAFAVMHSLLCGGGDDGVQTMDLVTLLDDTNGLFAWKAHVSSTANYAMEGLSVAAPDEFEFIKVLLGPLSGILLDRKVHSLKCFLGVLPNGKVHSESQFDGDYWEWGTRALDDCGAQWLQHGHYEIRKQFILFAPCQLSDLKDGASLAEEARAEGRRLHDQPPH